MIDRILRTCIYNSPYFFLGLMVPLLTDKIFLGLGCIIIMFVLMNKRENMVIEGTVIETIERINERMRRYAEQKEREKIIENSTKW